MIKLFFKVIVLIFFLITDLNSNAQALSWAKGIGGASADEEGLSMATDKRGNIYYTGYFQLTADFDPGSNTYNLTSKGGRDIFVLKLDSLGNFIWAKSMGSATADDYGLGITVDKFGNIYTVGFFNGTVDFDPGTGTNNLTTTLKTTFLQKLDSSGNFKWALKTGGTLASGIGVDTSGNLFLTGYFYNTADFDPGTQTYNLTSNGASDIFVQKLTSTGAFAWAKKFGSRKNEFGGYSLSLDKNGNVYSTGYFEDTADFDPGTGVYNLISKGGYADVYVSKLDPLGNFVWAKVLGGTGNEVGLGIGLDNNQNVFCTGHFLSDIDLDPGTNTYILYSNGGFDGFIVKLNSSGNFVWGSSIGSNKDDAINGVSVNKSGQVFTIGEFSNTIDFDPGKDTLNLSSFGNSDIFVQKFDTSGKLIWAKNFGGKDHDVGNFIKINSSNDILINGSFGSKPADFNPSSNVYSLYSSGYLDVFAAKLKECQNTSSTVVIVNCDSIRYHGKLYLTSGVFSQKLENNQGCDSLVNLKITINKSSVNSFSKSECDSFNFFGKFYKASGTYKHKIKNSRGCDSIIKLLLTINKKSAFTLNQTSCDTFQLNGKKYYATGTYFQTLTNKASCDSLITLKLTIKKSSVSFVKKTACDSFLLNGKFYNNSGTYFQTLKSKNGCDSTINLTLVINRSVTNTITKITCDTFILNGTPYVLRGSYIQNFKTNNGCDSFLNLIMKESKLDNSVSQVGSVLTSNANNTKYQWLNCNNSYLPITGETNKIFSPKTNGKYAVKVKKNFCEDTSNCYIVNSIGIIPLTKIGFEIYPNPNSGMFEIKIYNSKNSECSIEIFNSTGQSILKNCKTTNKEIRVNLSDQSDGIYYIKLSNKDNFIFKKLNIQH